MVPKCITFTWDFFVMNELKMYATSHLDIFILGEVCISIIMLRINFRFVTLLCIVYCYDK